jgi:hypothetical protein
MGIKITPTDRLFTKVVKELADWKCERCHKEYPKSAKGFGVSHFFGRNVLATRHNTDNCIAACRGCHQWLSDHAPDYCEFMFKKLGERRWLRLRVMSKHHFKQNPLTEAHVKLSIKRQLEELLCRKGK